MRCIGCGRCCGRYLPLSEADVFRVINYAADHGIEPRHSASSCPWLDKEAGRCLVYQARPEICRAYHCERSKQRPIHGEPGDYHVYDTQKLFHDGDTTTHDEFAMLARAMMGGAR